MLVVDAFMYCEKCRDYVDQGLISSEKKHGTDVYRCVKGHKNQVKLVGANRKPKAKTYRLKLPNRREQDRIHNRKAGRRGERSLQTMGMSL